MVVQPLRGLGAELHVIFGKAAVVEEYSGGFFPTWDWGIGVLRGSGFDLLALCILMVDLIQWLGSLGLQRHMKHPSLHKIINWICFSILTCSGSFWLVILTSGAAVLKNKLRSCFSHPVLNH